MTPLKYLAHRLAIIALVMVAATHALAVDVTAGPNNALPKPDVVMDNGTVNAKGFSNDPQICRLYATSTGPTAASTSLTVFKSATLLVPLAPRGNVTANATQGTCTLTRSGLYKARVSTFCTAATTETTALEISSTTDDLAYTQIPGAAATIKHLTGVLGQNASMEGFIAVTPAQALAGTFHIVWRGSNSAATTTCSQGGLTVERVDQAQPAAYP